MLSGAHAVKRPPLERPGGASGGNDRRAAEKEQGPGGSQLPTLTVSVPHQIGYTPKGGHKSLSRSEVSRSRPASIGAVTPHPVSRRAHPAFNPSWGVQGSSQVPLKLPPDGRSMALPWISVKCNLMVAGLWKLVVVNLWVPLV